MDLLKLVTVTPGRYVIAVSGGVDSMVLLDLLRQHPHLQLTVAHFDHGIRKDSKQDRLLVQEVSRKHGIPFVYQEGYLGVNASEDEARKARYQFLRQIQKSIGADGIITAHHHDDVLETATHNIMRGTGRKGMSSLKSIDGIVRPLINIPKSHLTEYAGSNEISWREDSTNTDTAYMRNFIRHNILRPLKEQAPEKYEQLQRIVKRQAELNQAIDAGLRTLLHVQPSIDTLKRNDVIGLPHTVQQEIVSGWLRDNGYRDFGRKHIERATIALKTAQPNTEHELNKTYKIVFDTKYARFVGK